MVRNLDPKGLAGIVCEHSVFRRVNSNVIEGQTMAGFFEGFTEQYVTTSHGEIRLRHGGSGFPILLLHGHPRTHTTWFRVAPRLDLRGLEPRRLALCKELVALVLFCAKRKS